MRLLTCLVLWVTSGALTASYGLPLAEVLSVMAMLTLAGLLLGDFVREDLS